MANKPKEEGGVTVEVLAAALNEEGSTHMKGDTFTTTAERAAALGDAVKIVA